MSQSCDTERALIKPPFTYLGNLSEEFFFLPQYPFLLSVLFKFSTTQQLQSFKQPFCD